MGKIITELRKIWPELVVVHGKPRHSQSQGGIERHNRTMVEKLGNWMTENKSMHWATVGRQARWSCTCSSTPSLPTPSALALAPSSYRRLICKWQINSQYSEAVGNTPHELTLGQAPKCGLSALPIAASVLMLFVHSFLHPIPTNKQLVCGRLSPRKVSSTRFSATRRQETWSHLQPLPVPPRTLWLLHSQLGGGIPGIVCADLGIVR